MYKHAKRVLAWDFQEANLHPEANHLTFSIGIFQWLGRKSGGLKRGKAICRVRGLVAEPDAVYNKAELICERLNSGEWKPEGLQRKTFDVRKEQWNVP